MKPSFRKALKRTGIVLAILLLLAIAFGFYLNSILPKSIGTPIQLQTSLFTRPVQPFPMEGRFIYKSATTLASMIRSRQASSVEIVQEFLANIRNNNWKYNALIWLRESEALKEAQQADEAVAKGDTLQKPLLGVPVTVKELFWVKGSPSTMNAKMFGFTAPSDGAVVEQLKRAGAIVLGTTNVPYMLSDYQTYGEVYPTCNNPYDTTRTPGGSTGGGAAALAAGFTTLEIGSDMGGSIRVPAAFCGLWALKPSFGAVNLSQGVGPDTITPINEHTRFALASAGPLARSADDLELAWELIKGAKIDPRFQEKINWQPASDRSLSQYKVAWMDEWKHGNETAKVGNEVKAQLNKLLAALQGKGVVVARQAPDSYDDQSKLFFASFASMITQGQPWLLRKLIAMDFERMDNGSPNFKAFAQAADESSDAGWAQLQAERKALMDKWDSFFKEYDFFLCPVTYGPAFTKCKSGARIQGDNGIDMAYADYEPYASIFNATGHPCIIIPMGLDNAGLPIALQLVGPMHSEPEMLHFAKLLANLTPGFVRPPSPN